jgi:prophage antirepressor-like protein
MGPWAYVPESILGWGTFCLKEIGAKFRRWIAYDVLPAIIKTGTYTATASDQQHFAPFGITLQLKKRSKSQTKP